MRPRENTTATVLHRCCLLLLALALAACAKPTDTARFPADPALASDTWNRFVAISERNESQAGPFRLNATLYYSGKEESQRVTVYFWGNGDATAPLPLRMDILVGTGSVVAQGREDSRGLFIHVPREGKIYFTEGGSLLAFDLPVPFALEDVALLVSGRFTHTFVPRDAEAGGTPNATQGADTGITYAVPGSSLGGFVTLGTDGLPVAWNDGVENGWSLAIDYWPDSTRPTPRKLYIRHAQGREATLIVRELAHPDAPFTPEQLALVVPPGTPLASLDDNR